MADSGWGAENKSYDIHYPIIRCGELWLDLLPLL
jgi:hypothetical protein